MMIKIHMKIMLITILLLASGMTTLTVNAKQHQLTAKKQPTSVKTVQLINLNTATIAELKTLQGIGLKKAAAIVNYRQQHGPFKSIDELIKVKGISKKIVNANRAHLQVVPIGKQHQQAP